MRGELRTLHRRLGITTIYVTHDQVEALSMSTRIGLMNKGQIEQEGRPIELYQNPASDFVANFVGSTNLLEAVVLGGADGTWVLETRAGHIQAACPAGVGVGDRVTVSMRPENISLHRQQPSSGNVLNGQIELLTFLGESIECQVRVGGARLRIREHPTIAFQSGESAFVHIPYAWCTVISDHQRSH
jgi:iron(III) transport system ATP-binding protein